MNESVSCKLFFFFVGEFVYFFIGFIANYAFVHICVNESKLL